MFFLACTPDQQTHLLELTLQLDGGEERLRIRGGATWEPTTMGLRAAWPHVSEVDGSDTDGDSFTTDFFPDYLGRYDTVPTSELRYEGSTYGNAGNAGVVLHVDRIVWQGRASFPYAWEGRVTGVVGGVGVDGTFSVGTDNCKNDVISTGNGCGGPAAGDATGTVTGMTYDTCPAEIRALFAGGDTVSFDGKSLVWDGAPEALECVATEGDEFGRHACGADTTVDVEGCTWNVSAVGWPGGPQGGPYLRVSGTVPDDGDCAYAACALEPIVTLAY